MRLSDRLRKKRKQFCLIKANDILKWIYPEPEHPWWIVLCVKRRWMTIPEALKAKDDWYLTYPQDLKHGAMWRLFYEDRPLFKMLVKEA